MFFIVPKSETGSLSIYYEAEMGGGRAGILDKGASESETFIRYMLSHEPGSGNTELDAMGPMSASGGSRLRVQKDDYIQVSSRRWPI